MYIVYTEERGKIRLTDSGSVLTLFNTTKSDSGVFTCIANNGVPASKPVEISETFYLLVRRKYRALNLIYTNPFSNLHSFHQRIKPFSFRDKSLKRFQVHLNSVSSLPSTFLLHNIFSPGVDLNF